MTQENRTQPSRWAAFRIGAFCVFTYLINYYIRKLLPVLSRDMIDGGTFDEIVYGLISSTYMITYAAGQLVNGIIGDYVKPKYMVSLGLVLASGGLSLFTFTSSHLLAIVGFGIVGFGLSMMRGPLVKVISENMDVKYARLSCTFLSFVSFAGPLLVGLVALFLDWHGVFVFSAIFTLVLSVLVFLTLTLFEKRGMIRPVELSKDKSTRQKGDFFRVFKLKNFVIYIFIGMIIETLAISLDQWLTIFFSEHLLLSDDVSKIVYYVISVLRALCPFISLLFFKLFRGQDLRLIRAAYVATAALFLTLLFAPGSYLGAGLLALALMCASIASSTMWSIYIPSLGKSGKVSSVNGILDSFGYAGASVMNMAFALINANFGGDGLIIAWVILPTIGVILTLLGKKEQTNE